ncbi:hypothetical protein [Vibrio phage phiKT1019]|nr:hypothetical protein [Vibrio phage phiKT1019]
MSIELNLWTYDELNPDDYREIRAFDTRHYVYCQIEYDTHSEESHFFGDTFDHHVPIVILRQLSPEVLLSHLRKLETLERNRIIVFIPQYQEMLDTLTEHGYEVKPAAGE